MGAAGSMLVQCGMAAAIAMLPLPAFAQDMRLHDVASWGYQLQGATPEDIAQSPYDLVVIDYSRDGTDETAFSPAEVEQMRRGPNGKRRVVLAYLSVGEAEDYRYYWQAGWGRQPPSWLGPENPDWKGNFPVRYWDTSWQNIIFGSADAYLDKIVAAGFDGIYVDRVDSFDETLPGAPNRATRMSSMVELILALSRYARTQKPGFLVVPQNGEELLAVPQYAAAIDGLGKEDLFFGVKRDGAVNSKALLRSSLRYLQPFLDAGKPVFLVEYVTSPSAIATAESQAKALSVPLFLGDRALDKPLGGKP